MRDTVKLFSRMVVSIYTLSSRVWYYSFSWFVRMTDFFKLCWDSVRHSGIWKEMWLQFGPLLNPLNLSTYNFLHHEMNYKISHKIIVWKDSKNQWKITHNLKRSLKHLLCMRLFYIQVFLLQVFFLTGNT